MSNNQTVIERPSNIHAEEGLIGSVLMNPVLFSEMKDIQPHDFYVARNAWVWEAFFSLHENGVEIDLITITNELDRKNRLEELGGPAYLTRLLGFEGTSLHAHDYAADVKEYSVRRKILDSSARMAEAAFNKEMRIDNLLGVMNQATDIVHQSIPTTNIISASTAASEMYDDIGKVAASQIPPSIPTGFYDLDRILEGLYDECLYVFATRPGLGKTTLLCDIARHAGIKRRKAVGMWMLEMTSRQTIRRLIAGEYSLSSKNMKSGRLADDEWPTVVQALEETEDWPIVIDPTAGLTVETLAARASILKARNQLDLMIVDYIQLMRTVAEGRMRSRQQEVGHITRMLKEMSKNLHIPIVAAAQVNRLVEQRSNKRLMLSDLREAGDIEQDADVVIFIQPPSDDQPEDKPIQNIEVAKQREGATGVCELINNRRIPRFESLHVEHVGKDWWS